MELHIVNQHLAGNLIQAWQNRISRAHGRHQVPREWEVFLGALRQMYSTTEAYPSVWEIPNNMTSILSEAIDEYFFLGNLRHFDTENYLAEDDDLNRLYDQITGRYSRRYREYLARRH